MSELEQSGRLQEQVPALCRRIAALEKENRKYRDHERDAAELGHFLKERIKELSCLYGVAQQIERCGNSIETLLQGIVELLPGSWQYPEITCGRIVLEDTEYVTAGFRMSQWRQAANIKVGNKNAGVVEVYYLEEMPTLAEGPFLAEERLLIDAVGERIGRATERIHAQHQLEVERAALKNMNIALREVLGKVQDEKRQVGDAVQANVDSIIMPILDALEGEVPPEQRGYAVMLKRNLEEITSPFANKLSKAFMKLTPVEIRICDMIRRGLSTKEIAQLRHVSPATVNRHREHIRSKLGITNQRINLAGFLGNYMLE